MELFFLNCILFLAVVGLCCCRGFSLVVGAGASHCGGFSCGAQECSTDWAAVAHRPRRTQASALVACGLSSCNSWALEHGLSCCGAWAWLRLGMRHLPGPGIEPVSSALAGGFSHTVLPGKSQCSCQSSLADTSLLSLGAIWLPSNLSILMDSKQNREFGIWLFCSCKIELFVILLSSSHHIPKAIALF